jgi:hypothetical protein
MKMKLLSNQACNGKRLMILNLLDLSILFLVSCPSLLAAQKAPTVMRATVETGKTTRKAFSITNDCREEHHFRIKSKVKFIRFEQPTDAILIGPHSTREIGVEFSATGLASKVYLDEFSVECRDCKKGRGCVIERSRINVEMTVTKPAPQKPTPGERVPWSRFAAVFSEFSETLSQLERETWARDKNIARLIKSIRHSTDRLKAKCGPNPAPGPKDYLESLQMNLNALKDLRKSATGTGKKMSRIQDARLVHTGLPSYLVKTVLTQKTTRPADTTPARSFRGTSPPKASLPRSAQEVLDVVDRDMQTKAEHSAKTTEECCGLVKVSVFTKQGNTLVHGREVWCVPEFWMEYPDKWSRFLTLSSPSEKSLAPGHYKMGINNREGQLLEIGGDGETHKRVDLSVR